MSRRFWLPLAALTVFLAFAAAALLAIRGAGRWLIRQDPLRPAGVIVVLSGDMPWRAEEAARLFRLGDARQIWVSRPDFPAAELQAMGIQYLGEDYYNRQVLLRSGVPETAIRVLPEGVVDTQQEVVEIAREMSRAGETTVIIVTSPQHTRRVKVLWRKLVGDHPTAIVRAAFQDPFDKDHWWHNTRDTYSVVREWMGLMNAWAGLPVHPRSP
jgi:uncharacterized SAM-binding protein YcdF (DUF218 family)